MLHKFTCEFCNKRFKAKRNDARFCPNNGKCRRARFRKRGLLTKPERMVLTALAAVVGNGSLLRCQIAERSGKPGQRISQETTTYRNLLKRGWIRNIQVPVHDLIESRYQITAAGRILLASDGI